MDFSFVYVIFADGTDPYWARSRVLEYLNGLSSSLPQNVSAKAGPRRDRCRLGLHVCPQFEAARPGRASLDAGLVSALSTCQRGRRGRSRLGWRVREAVPNHGGSLRLRAYHLSISNVAMAVQRSNGEVGGGSIEMAEKEFMLRVRGYLSGLPTLGRWPSELAPKALRYALATWPTCRSAPRCAGASPNSMARERPSAASSSFAMAPTPAE